MSTQILGAIESSALLNWPPQTAVWGEAEQLQQQHYDEIGAEYHAHYSDSASLEYRWRFIYEPMFAGLNLRNMRVLDAMCGSGQTTEFLLEKQAIVTGLDISREVIHSFRSQWPTCQAVQRSLLESGLLFRLRGRGGRTSSHSPQPAKGNARNSSRPETWRVFLFHGTAYRFIAGYHSPLLVQTRSLFLSERGGHRS